MLTRSRPELSFHGLSLTFPHSQCVCVCSLLTGPYLEVNLGSVQKAEPGVAEASVSPVLQGHRASRFQSLLVLIFFEGGAVMSSSTKRIANSSLYHMIGVQEKERRSIFCRSWQPGSFDPKVP